MKKLLVANRSEIAVRIFRSATELNFGQLPFTLRKTGSASIGSRPTKLIWSGREGPVAAYLDIDSIISWPRKRGLISFIRVTVSSRRTQNLQEPVKRRVSPSSDRDLNCSKACVTKWLQKNPRIRQAFPLCLPRPRLSPSHARHWNGGGR